MGMMLFLASVSFLRRIKMRKNTIRWQREQVQALYAKPFLDLIFEAHTVHLENFPKNRVQISTLLSIKTGSCPEDCAYCPQSAHYETGVKKEKLMEIEAVIEQAKIAKQKGASRFCMGAAWKNPPKQDFPKVLDMIKEIKNMGLETCVTLGTLDENHVTQLKAAGLDYYNHNLDTSPEFYPKIITTRTYDERLDTLEKVRNSGIKVCCGGILGMGEAQQDRIGLLLELANMEQHPESVPINKLIRVKGTPLGEVEEIDDLEFIRAIAVARIMMPTSYVRLSAGRESMSDSMQVLCFFAGANSIFYGEKLLVTPNPLPSRDKILFQKLGIEPLIPPTLNETSHEAGCELPVCE
jgi:biotin synthase